MDYKIILPESYFGYIRFVADSPEEAALAAREHCCNPADFDQRIKSGTLKVIDGDGNIHLVKGS